MVPGTYCLQRQDGTDVGNPCSGAFRNVWVPLGLFRYCVKLGANRAELVQLMQKFVPRSHLGIFHNERTQSTLFDPKLMFWCIS